MYNHLNLHVCQSRAIQCIFACMFTRVHAHGYGHAYLRVLAVVCAFVYMSACARLRACVRLCWHACVKWVHLLARLSPYVIARVLVMRACELLSCMYGHCVPFIEYF